MLSQHSSLTAKLDSISTSARNIAALGALLRDNRLWRCCSFDMGALPQRLKSTRDKVELQQATLLQAARRLASVSRDSDQFEPLVEERDGELEKWCNTIDQGIATVDKLQHQLMEDRELLSEQRSFLQKIKDVPLLVPPLADVRQQVLQCSASASTGNATSKLAVCDDIPAHIRAALAAPEACVPKLLEMLNVLPQMLAHLSVTYNTECEHTIRSSATSAIEQLRARVASLEARPWDEAVCSINQLQALLTAQQAMYDDALAQQSRAQQLRKSLQRAVTELWQARKEEKTCARRLEDAEDDDQDVESEQTFETMKSELHQKKQLTAQKQQLLAELMQQLSTLDLIPRVFPDLAMNNVAIFKSQSSARSPLVPRSVVAKLSDSAAALVNVTAGFEDFAVEKHLARTAQAEVLLVRNKTTEELCVLKVLRANSVRSQREVNQLAKLRHPLVISLQRVFQGRYKFSVPTQREDDALFLQMPYYSEGHLREWATQVQTEARSTSRGLSGARLLEVRRVFHQLLQVLSFMHLRGVVHRDLKFENILKRYKLFIMMHLLNRVCQSVQSLTTHISPQQRRSNCCMRLWYLT